MSRELKHLAHHFHSLTCANTIKYVRSRDLQNKTKQTTKKQKNPEIYFSLIW